MPPESESLYQPLVQAPATAMPLHLVITTYVAVALLLFILLMLLKISSQLATRPARSSSGSRPEKTSVSATPIVEGETNVAEVEPGTPFEEFLNEDPQRHTLTKKEQFKEYRKWRADRGLNWKK